ncbi:MAG: XRE family transcriptional regulator [Acidobacteria bacterium]|nr:XRE family transcriptional regulator [Acidobacteriota bacterium]
MTSTASDPRRRRRNRAEIEVLVREFRESGLTQAGFARKVGVQPPAVSRWVRLASMARPPSTSPRFIPVRIRSASSLSTPHAPEWPEIVAPSGWRLRVPPAAEPARLTELLSLLPRC